jgi:hypothetical protein
MGQGKGEERGHSLSAVRKLSYCEIKNGNYGLCLSKTVYIGKGKEREGKEREEEEECGIC